MGLDMGRTGVRFVAFEVEVEVELNEARELFLDFAP